MMMSSKYIFAATSHSKWPIFLLAPMLPGCRWLLSSSVSNFQCSSVYSDLPTVVDCMASRCHCKHYGPTVCLPFTMSICWSIYTLLSCFLAIFLSLCSPFNLSSFLHDHRTYSPISVIFGFLLHPICFNNERYLLRLICEVSVNARKTLFFVCQKEPCFRRLLSNSCDGK